MLRVDPEKMEAELAVLQKAMETQVNLPGLAGTIARMQMAVVPALSRWRMSEINRGAEPNDVANALVALIASTLFSEACSVYGHEIDDDHYSFLNTMMMGIAEETGAMMTGNRRGMTSKFIGGTEIGSA